MPNAVEIVIRVDNAQGNAALGQTITKVEDLGAKGREAMGSFAKASGDASAGADRFGAAAGRMNGHVTTSLDGVRLLSQEFGFRLPRALESMLARMPAVTDAISKFIGVSAGIAVAEVFFRIGESVYNAYTKYISLNAAAEAFKKTMQERDDADFIDSHSIEVTRDRLKLANDEAKQLIEQGKELHSFGGIVGALNNVSSLGDLGGVVAGFRRGRTLTDEGYKLMLQADELRRRQPGEQSEINRLDIEAKFAKTGQYEGQTKINQELQKSIALSQEGARLRREQDNLAPVDHPSDQKSIAEIQIATRKAAAESVVLNREATEQIIRMQNEATNAGLAGTALLRSQQEQAIAAVERAFKDGKIGERQEIAETAALQTKYDNEEMSRMLATYDTVQRLRRESSIAGLKGADRILGEQNVGIENINTDRNLSPEEAAAKRLSLQAETNQKMLALQSEYTDRVNAEIDARTAASLRGFAKIDAEETRLINESKQKLSETYGSATVPKAALDAQSREQAGIHDAAGSQRLELQQQIQQQTLQMTTEAAQAERRVRGAGIAGWVEDYRNGIAEIQAAETAMLHRIADEQQKTGHNAETDELFNQQRVAAVQKANAQIESLNQQMAHQVASTLQGAFDDPVHFIQNRMKQMFFEIMANWLMQSKAFQAAFGGIMGTSTGAGRGGIVGSSGTSAGVSAAGGIVGAGSAINGTVSHASISPGYSGTAGSAGSTFGGSLSTAGSIAQMGLSAIGYGGGAGAGIADSDPNDTSAHEDDHSGGGIADPGASSGASSSSTPNAIGGLVGAGFGAYTGTKGIIDAFESGKASGIFTGAESGAAMGASIGMLGGPVGAAIGAGIGAVGGATAGLVGWASGEGNRLGAAKYFKTNTRPEMEGELQSYTRGGGDAISAISQVNDTAAKAFYYMASKFGGGAAQWAKAAYIDKEVQSIQTQINGMARGGRDYMSRSAAQFHSGGMIGGFGDLATSSNEGFIHAMLNETVMNPGASMAHGRALGMMNAGASDTDIAAHYLRTTGGAPQSQSPQAGDTHHHWSVQAMDAKSFEQFLTRGGGSTAMARAANKYVSQYSGDAANG